MTAIAADVLSFRSPRFRAAAPPPDLPLQAVPLLARLRDALRLSAELLAACEVRRHAAESRWGEPPLFFFDRTAYALPNAQSSGRSRSWLVYVPSTYDPTQPTPVVVLLHGRPGNRRALAHGRGRCRASRAVRAARGLRGRARSDVATNRANSQAPGRHGHLATPAIVPVGFEGI